MNHPKIEVLTYVNGIELINFWIQCLGGTQCPLKGIPRNILDQTEYFGWDTYSGNIQFCDWFETEVLELDFGGPIEQVHNIRDVWACLRKEFTSLEVHVDLGD